MFTDLKVRLLKGQSVSGALTSASAGTIDLAFAITSMGANAGSDADNGRHGSMPKR
jgi:hypothetical protein